MMPLHYALTDGMVFVAAAWGAWQLMRAGKPVGALGVALFGLAAAIGTVRVTSGLIEPLAVPHRFASQIGGLLGLLLLLWQIFKTTVGPVRSVYGAAICVSAVVLAITLPAARAPIYILALIAGIALFGLDRLSGKPNLGAALGFGVMLPNVLFLRQSQFLGPDLSWHLFHIVIALWLMLTVLALTPRQVAEPVNTTSAA
jgi:hypothetical protein